MISDKIVAGLGGALLASLWIDWYSLEATLEEGATYGLRGPGFNAWQAFGFVDVLLAAVAVLALLFPLVFSGAAKLAGGIDAGEKGAGTQVAARFAFGALTLGMGSVAFLLVIYRIVERPLSGDFDGVEVDIGLKAGPFVALVLLLLGAVAIFAVALEVFGHAASDETASNTTASARDRDAASPKHQFTEAEESPANQRPDENADDERRSGLKKCPDCAEMVQAEARKCRFCSYRFDDQSPQLES